ncbi:MAG TPA: hypothetical protein VLF39_03520 [Candidatus Saccharimonadales bacterium]|nr:hypothetical protein [Candidatus Saccharimonadales bacterium]
MAWKYHEHQQHASFDEAATLAKATADLGYGKVTALANEGDQYKNHLGDDRVVEGGHMLIKLSGDFPETTDAVYAHAEQIQREHAPQSPEQAK